MPVNIMVGILSLFIALILYSIAVWSAFRKKTFTTKHVAMLWVGFFFDTLATAMMAIQVGGVQHDLHSIIAFTAMFAMLAVAILATIWVRSGSRDRLAALATWALVGWALWVGVFVWGMISRGAQRVTG